MSVTIAVLKAHKRKKSMSKLMTTLFLHLLVIIGSLIMVIPFLWMVLSSFKEFSQIFAVPPVWIPHPVVWENFTDSLKAMPFGKAYINSSYISLLVVATQIVTCSLAAYSFARINFSFRNAIFVVFLATMMVPAQVTIVPLYLIMMDLGWLDTHLSLIMPSALFNAFGVFLLRQFVLNIPNELSEAAVMDGANHWTIYSRIILPLIKPALAALGIFSFLGIWNSLFYPLIFLSSMELYTVPLLLNMFKGIYITNWSLMMAGSTIAVIPVLIIYIIGQRQIIEGITLSGIKG
jgi:multiple sugar transport system permease protein